MYHGLVHFFHQLFTLRLCAVHFQHAPCTLEYCIFTIYSAATCGALPPCTMHYAAWNNALPRCTVNCCMVRLHNSPRTFHLGTKYFHYAPCILVTCILHIHSAPSYFPLSPFPINSEPWYRAHPPCIVYHGLVHFFHQLFTLRLCAVHFQHAQCTLE